MKSIIYGIFFAIFGLGSLILPMIGIQFKLFMLFELMLGSFAWMASTLFILIGIGLIMYGIINIKKKR